MPLKVLEHPFGLARLAATPADVVHLQWLAVPELDSWLLRHRAPLVLTAHDLLPRRTAAKTGLWRRAFGRFERIVVHSERGRETLAAFGVRDEKLRVIPHPVTPSDPVRADDGRTVLALGLVRPYKQLDHAREAVAPCAGSAAPRRGRRRRASSPRRRSTAHSASRPSPSSRTAPSSTRAAPSCARSAPACRRSSTTSAASPSPCGAFGAGRVVAPDDVDALAAAISELVDDETALADARAGALRARDELTWAASAQAHLALYEELL